MDVQNGLVVDLGGEMGGSKSVGREKRREESGSRAHTQSKVWGEAAGSVNLLLPPPPPLPPHHDG